MVEGRAGHCGGVQIRGTWKISYLLLKITIDVVSLVKRMAAVEEAVQWEDV